MSRGTQDADPLPLASSTGLSPALVRRSSRFKCLGLLGVGPTTPVTVATHWFGLLPVRSPLLRESRLISFRRATEMFQFAHDPPPCLWIQHGVSRHHSGWVAPLGDSGFSACMQLPLNVSPVSASFIGLSRRGIHLVLYRACEAPCSSRLRVLVVSLRSLLLVVLGSLLGMSTSDALSKIEDPKPVQLEKYGRQGRGSCTPQGASPNDSRVESNPDPGPYPEGS